MKVIIRVITCVILLAANPMLACECWDVDATTGDANKSAPWSDDTTYQHGSVIFMGELLGWDWYALRIFKVLRAYKGIGDGVEYIVLRSQTCGMKERRGGILLVSAYAEPPRETAHGDYPLSDPFLVFSNCHGTRNVSEDEVENGVAYMEAMRLENGLQEISLDNRALQDLSQKLANSLNHRFVVRDMKSSKVLDNPGIQLRPLMSSESVLYGMSNTSRRANTPNEPTTSSPNQSKPKSIESNSTLIWIILLTSALGISLLVNIMVIRKRSGD